MTARTMVNLIHANGFFPPGDAEKYAMVTNHMNYTQKSYGQELENFNMILPGMEPVFSKVLGEKVVIDNKRSGIFRRPMQCVHFEGFDTLNEWCFVVALEKTTFNMYHHIAQGNGESGIIDAKTALEGYQYNYRNLFEWNIETNVVLQPNEGVFFRPWVFHSLDGNALVQYYRLLTDRQFRVLIMGDDNENRSIVAKAVAGELDAELHVSRDWRTKEKDIDYTEDGQSRHAYRMLDVCRKSRHPVIVVDMQAPLPMVRDTLNPDIIVWVNTKPAKDTFVAPPYYDFRVKSVNDEIIGDIIERIKTKRI